MKSFIVIALITIYSCTDGQQQISLAKNNFVSPLQIAGDAGLQKPAKLSAQKKINLKDYGAKGLGIESLKEDTTALRNVIRDLNKAGGGVLYVPNPPKFYAFAGNGLFIGDNIEIYGDGKGKSEIRNVSPLSGNFYNGNIFVFSTYGPNDVNSIFQPGVESYDVQDAKEGDASLVLKDKSKAAGLYAGEVVVVGAGKFKHSGMENKTRFHYMELNLIMSVKDGVITFKHPISVPLATDASGDAPQIVNINNAKSTNKALKIINKTSKNVYIHDMSLVQAQTDELTNTPINTSGLKTGLSSIWAPGGAYESQFKNLYISGGGDLGGNMFTRCIFDNIEIHSPKKLVDFGYGSSNDTIQNVNWIFLEKSASDFVASFIIINDGTHNIVINNLNASGNWDGESIMLLSQTSGIKMNQLVFNFPNYRKNKAAIQIGDEEGVISRDISMSNVHLTVAGINQFLRISGNQKVMNANRNISISNCDFKGTVATDNSIKSVQKSNLKVSKTIDNPKSVFIKNINGLTLKDISLSSGDLLFEDCNNSNIEGVVAPSSDMTLSGSSSNTRYSNMSIRSKNIKDDVKRIKQRRGSN